MLQENLNSFYQYAFGSRATLRKDHDHPDNFGCLEHHRNIVLDKHTTSTTPTNSKNALIVKKNYYQWYC